MGNRVIIIGGGLAGLAAATQLAPNGYQVTILEARNRLGGRAGSFQDASTGQLIDNCQHVSMGCCTAFAQFCKTVGISHLFAAQPILRFMTPDGRISKWKMDALPAPMHMARGFLRIHFLTWKEKVDIIRSLLALKKLSPEEDGPFHEWLIAQGQSPAAQGRFWGLVLTSALNESIENVGLKYARKVFVDAYLGTRADGVVYLPTVPLDRLYGEELKNWMARHSVEMRMNESVRTFRIEHGLCNRVELRSGEAISGDWCICTAPFDRFLKMVRANGTGASESVMSQFQSISGLDVSPITSIHLWYDQPVMEWTHVVLVDCLGQWIFDRGESLPGEFGIQIVISAAREVQRMGKEEVIKRVCQEIEHLLISRMTSATPPRLLRSRVVTEHRATFSAVPGVDELRPDQSTYITNLFLAGDWTQTGWPATMEGAVRSGFLAAEKLMDKSARVGIDSKGHT